ncbi:MAG: hypothetical protein BAJATHORv1_90066 [Candidatus Thorarchaeota archaeon]|nr:MAG: hypothetical protein BAJATHORv1_90066 [Candidatus Thorarchaeota archaeon]
MTEVQKSFERLISLAIQREEEAYEFYKNAAEEATLSSSAKLLEDLAHQEVTHKEKLEKALSEGVCDTFECKTEEELDKLDLGKYLVDVPLKPDSSPQDILVVAIKREEGAYNFYKALSELTSVAEHRTIFETLAEEEQKHKDRLQQMYDDIFQPDM